MQLANSKTVLILLLTLIPISHTMMLRKQNTVFKSEDRSFHGDSRFNFLKGALNRKNPHHDWRQIGTNPSHDIKLKYVISASVSSALMHQYILFNDQQRSVHLIYGEIKPLHREGYDILKLVFVIKNGGKNEGFYGVEVRVKHCDYQAGIDRLQVTRYGQSFKCHDVLNLLEINQQRFRKGPNLNFMNMATRDRRLLHRVHPKILEFASKSMNQLVKMHLGLLNGMLSRIIGGGNSGNRGHKERNVRESRHKKKHYLHDMSSNKHSLHEMSSDNNPTGSLFYFGIISL